MNSGAEKRCSRNLQSGHLFRGGQRITAVFFFPEVNISEARKEPAKEIIQKLKKIISCQPRPQGAIPWHASLFFSHILLFCPLVLKLQNSSYTHCNSERQKRALDYRSRFILCILPGKEKNCWGNCQMYRN